MTTAFWRRAASNRWAVPGAIALAVLPLVVSAVALVVRVGGDYRPSADEAWIELQIRDIGHHPVLLGPYSRFGWFHPGPVLYYLLWLPYRITGSTGASLALAALTLNAVVVVGIALVARKRGELPLVLLTLFLVGLLGAGEGAQFFRDVWNPLVTVLPFVLLVLVAWSLACAEAWALPVGAVVATFLVQTHVGYGLVAVALVLAGLAGAAITAWRRRGDAHHGERVRAWSRMGVVTAGVGALLWLPVVVQQVRDQPGNVGTLLRFFRDHGREHSYGDAWHVVAAQLSAVPDWVRGHVVLDIYSGALDLRGATPIAVWGLVLVVAGVLAWRRAKDAFRLDVLVALTIAVAFLSVSRIVGEIFPYLVTWTWAVGMLTWLAIAWSVVRWWQARETADPRIGQVALGLVAVGLLVVTVVNTVDAATAGNPDPVGSRQVKGLVAKVHDALPAGDGVVEIRAAPESAGSAWVGAGVAAQLERDGVETRVAPDLGFAYGPDRVLGDEPVRLVVLPVEDADLAATEQLDCFEDAGRVEKYTLFLGDPECLGLG
jgi:hypothetical protein